MADISAKDVAALRKKTGASMMTCKQALQESGGDMEKAEVYLRQQDAKIAAKKSDRATEQGFIGHYVHGGRIGVLVEVACETDFVAKNDKFQEFIRDLSMHICATNPLAISPEELDPGIVNKEREIYLGQVKDKPENIQEKIVEGKMQKFYSENCLLQQAFVKDNDKTIAQHLTETIGTLGENIVIRRFSRLELGAE
ncbi:MAG: translation elongation factor Ts [Planctomycetota bacterium]|jgi:elongation factor Ts